MHELSENEKKTPAMFYTADALFHGEVISAKIVRVNIWMRTDSAPKYIHLVNAQMISLTGSGQILKLEDVFIPTNKLIAYHTAPGVEIDLDYNENEPNRRMAPTRILGSSFLVFNGESRISTQTNFGTTLEVGRTPWLSLYNVTVSTPNMPKLHIKAPMLLLRPTEFSFNPLD